MDRNWNSSSVLPHQMSTTRDGGGKPARTDLQMVVASPVAGGVGNASAIQAVKGGGEGSGAIVEYGSNKGVVLREEEEDLEVKLRRIIELVPVRVSNTSGSSAGSGSGDFHQYRQMRRKEQDRLARIDADYQRRKEIAEFEMRREERLKAAEDRTTKKRMKRQKKKQKKKEKKTKIDGGGGDSKCEPSDNSDDSEE